MNEATTDLELKSNRNVDQIVIRHDIEFKDLSLILDKRKRDFDTKLVPAEKLRFLSCIQPQA